MVTLIVKIASSWRRFASEFNFLLISVYECHHYHSTHIHTYTWSTQEVNEHFNILKWAVTLIWFCHSIDSVYSWWRRRLPSRFTAICFMTSRSSSSSQKAMNLSAKTWSDDFNSLNRRVIKQLQFSFIWHSFDVRSLMIALIMQQDMKCKWCKLGINFA